MLEGGEVADTEVEVGCVESSTGEISERLGGSFACDSDASFLRAAASSEANCLAKLNCSSARGCVAAVGESLLVLQCCLEDVGQLAPLSTPACFCSIMECTVTVEAIILQKDRFYHFFSFSSSSTA